MIGFEEKVQKKWAVAPGTSCSPTALNTSHEKLRIPCKLNAKFVISNLCADISAAAAEIEAGNTLLCNFTGFCFWKNWWLSLEILWEQPFLLRNKTKIYLLQHISALHIVGYYTYLLYMPVSTASQLGTIRNLRQPACCPCGFTWGMALLSCCLSSSWAWPGLVLPAQSCFPAVQVCSQVWNPVLLLGRVICKSFGAFKGNNGVPSTAQPSQKVKTQSSQTHDLGSIYSLCCPSQLPKLVLKQELCRIVCWRKLRSWWGFDSYSPGSVLNI